VDDAGETFRYAGGAVRLPLRTRRLLLRPADVRDVGSFVALLNDPVVHRGTLRIPSPYTEADARAYLRSARRARRRGTDLSLQIERRSDGAHVGGIGLHHLVDREVEAEIGYWIGAPYRRRGYASEAVGGMLRAAFGPLRLHRVFANVFAFNRASAGVLEGCGFHREGRVREGHRKDGRWMDELRYARLAGDPPVTRPRPPRRAPRPRSARAGRAG